MTDGWYIRKVGSASKGPYTREKIASGLGKLPTLDAVEVSHASETGGRWIPASEFQLVQETRRSPAQVAPPAPPRPPIVAELIEAEQIPAAMEPSATEVAIPADSRVAVQHSAEGHTLSRFMAEGQDPKMVVRFHGRVTDVCTREEVLEYMAIQQRPVANFSPDAVVLTNRRIMIFRQKLRATANAHDTFSPVFLSATTLTARSAPVPQSPARPRVLDPPGAVCGGWAVAGSRRR